MSAVGQNSRMAAGNRVCPVCHTESKPDALVCSGCGAALVDDSTTTRTTQTEPLERSDQILHYIRMYTDSILFFVMEESIPLMVKNTVSTITLGRNDPGSPNYHIDLSTYGALLLGVSRVHVKITTNHQTFMVEDLESTNGTLLNGIRLVSGLSYMLRNGDQLEVGRMKIQIFFSETEASAESIYVLNTGSRNGDASAAPFTLHDLSTSLSPYLKLIEDLQTQIHRMQGRKPESVGFTSLSLTKTQGVHVSLEGAAGAIDLLVKIIMPARQELRDAASADLDRKIRGVAEKCVLQTAKDLPGTLAENYIYQSLPLIKAFMTSPFEVYLQEQRGS